MISSIHKENWYADYIVHWRALDVCNYDCSYCTPALHKPIGEHSIPSADKLIAASQKIADSVDKNKSVIVVITGGEPFMIKDIDKWFRHMSNNNFRIVVFTNGSMPLKVFEKCKDSLKNLHLKISFHPEKNNIDNIVKLAKFAKENGGDIEIRGMLVPNLFDRVTELESRLQDIKVIKLPVFPLYNTETKHVNETFKSSQQLKGYHQTQDQGNLNYFSPDELKIIENLPTEESPEYLEIIVDGNITTASKLIYDNKNNFKGWKCYITSKKILIEPNGNIKYGTCNSIGIAGNIYNDDIKLFNKDYTICQKETCLTIDEIMVTKSSVF